MEDINGEIIEVKYYEQELLKSDFGFESNKKVLEKLNIVLSKQKQRRQEIDSIRLNKHHHQMLVCHQVRLINYF